MKIEIANPPILQKILDAGMHPTQHVIFTYGDTIYNPYNVPLTADLVEHEEVHCKQQGKDPEGWWTRYIDDPLFRVEEEVEAYAVQYTYICTQVRDRNRRHLVLRDLARSLSSPIYGSVISPSSAYNLIKQRAKV